jgi:ribonuclease R
MSKSIQEIIIEVLKEEPHKGFNHKQIAFRMPESVSVEGKGLIKILDSMVKKGQLKYDSHGKYGLNVKKVKGVSAVVEIHRKGGTYAVLKDSDERVKIPYKNLNKAFSGDLVDVFLSQKGRRPPKAEVIRITKRAKTDFVGLVVATRDGYFFEPDDKRIYTDFIFDRSEKMDKSLIGQKVIVNITKWKHSGSLPICTIKKVLGKPGEHETEILAISEEFGIEQHFPQEVTEEVKKMKLDISKSELKKRKDFRETLTITIDPHDAKDFDDAISFKELDENRFELGIHIADVSHFVVPGTDLDKEAYRRATSVYLVDRVIPMLPEKLSNNLCSLVPNEDRFCYSALFQIDGKGKVLKEWFGKSIIHSNQRFSYEQAQERIENRKGSFSEEIVKLNSIAKELFKTRFENGAMSFETTEVKFKLDKSGTPIGVDLKVRKDAHRMIEEFMLLANRRVANLFVKTTEKNGSKFVYRSHGEPSSEKLAELKSMAKKFGYLLKLGNYDELKDSINRMLEDCQGKPEENMLQQLAIKSMAKAVYTTSLPSHFGLGFDHYTHFTSPIRRYPDLIVHRLLEDLIKKRSSSSAGLEGACKQCSEMEQKAVSAERASIKYKQAEYLQDKKGQVFEGVVTGIIDWGIFVEIKENKCEGLIRLNSFKDDYYEYDKKRMRIRGRRKGRTITLGDQLDVIVVSTNPGKRQIDLELA